MQACLVSSIIICMYACLAHNYPEELSHCGCGHDLTSVASVVNIADIRSAFVETLASTTRRSRVACQRRASLLVYIYVCQDGGAVGFVDFTELP